MFLHCAGMDRMDLLADTPTYPFSKKRLRCGLVLIVVTLVAIVAAIGVAFVLSSSTESLGNSSSSSSKSSRRTSDLNDLVSNPARFANERKLNDRPIIGVLSQGLSASLKKMFPHSNYSSYIPSSYVRFLESSGARVVPVIVGRPVRHYRLLFGYLNGLLLPGGGASLEDSRYASTAALFWRLSQQQHEYFPIMGVCLGFEMISVLQMGGGNVLTPCTAENMALPLNITSVGRHSRILSAASASVVAILSRDNVTANFHHKCLTVDEFARSQQLNKFFTKVATNRDARGVEFVSAMEHRSRPVYALQFHPEKNIFEWSNSPHTNNIPHSAQAVKISQYFGAFFVNEARRSPHRFPSAEEEAKWLIYNYEPVYSGGRNGSATFTECYFFH